MKNWSSSVILLSDLESLRQRLPRPWEHWEELDQGARYCAA